MRFSSSKVLACLLFVLIIISGIYAQEGLKEYNDRNGLYSCKHPQNWRGKYQLSVVSFQPPDQTEAIMILPLPGTEISLNTLCNGMQQIVTHLFQLLVPTGMWQSTELPNCKQAVFMNYQGQQGYAARVWVLKNDYLSFGVLLAAPGQSFSEKNELYRSVIESIKPKWESSDPTGGNPYIIGSFTYYEGYDSLSG